MLQDALGKNCSAVVAHAAARRLRASHGVIRLTLPTGIEQVWWAGAGAGRH